MSGPVLYSTNCWFAHDVAMKYRGGKHFVWCSEFYDAKKAPPASASAAIAPSSSPKSIYDRLHADWKGEDRHSALISGYRKTFKRLAKSWLADGEITTTQHQEITATAKSSSWLIWRPTLFIIPKSPIEEAGRLITVPPDKRAALGPELQIVELMPHEFDLIEW